MTKSGRDKREPFHNNFKRTVPLIALFYRHLTDEEREHARAALFFPSKLQENISNALISMSNLHDLQEAYKAHATITQAF